jgi:hypothetical protein
MTPPSFKQFQSQQAQQTADRVQQKIIYINNINGRADNQVDEKLNRLGLCCQGYFGFCPNIFFCVCLNVNMSVWVGQPTPTYSTNKTCGLPQESALP